MSWNSLKFKDFILLQRGHDLTKEQIRPGKYPVVTSTSILGYHDEFKAKGPGVITGRSGTIGEVQYIEEDYWPHNTSLYVKDFKGNNPKFVYYFMRYFGTDRAQSGSAVPTLNRNNLSDILVNIPDVNTQNRIAEKLSYFDALVDNNKKQIILLEEIIDRLYQRWFVELKFPGYPECEIVNGLPEGWIVGKANDFFDITIGKTPPRAESRWFTKGKEGIPWVSISDMGNEGLFVYDTEEKLTGDAIERHNVKIVPEGTILLSFKLTLGRVSITTCPMCTNEAIAHFTIEKQNYREYTYSYLKNFEYDTLGNTSSISKAVNSTIIKSMPFIYPKEEIITNFSAITAPIMDEILVKQKQNRLLKESQDRLLLKYMTKEIQV